MTRSAIQNVRELFKHWPSAMVFIVCIGILVCTIIQTVMYAHAVTNERVIPESPPAGICKIFDNDGNLVDIDTPIFTNDAVSCMHGTYQSVNPRPMGE
jgi:hypothetical protein